MVHSTNELRNNHNATNMYKWHTGLHHNPNAVALLLPRVLALATNRKFAL
jgi:hypothetical protein